MDYTVLFFKECARCKQFEPDHKHSNCSFSIVRTEKCVQQLFECTRCKFKWTKELHNENSIDNRPTLRRKTG
jgi:hypothetical protein